MGVIFLEHPNGQRYFCCGNCNYTPLTNRSDLMSTRFTGSTGNWLPDWPAIILDIFLAHILINAEVSLSSKQFYLSTCLQTQSHNTKFFKRACIWICLYVFLSWTAGVADSLIDWFDWNATEFQSLFRLSLIRLFVHDFLKKYFSYLLNISWSIKCCHPQEYNWQ